MNAQDILIEAYGRLPDEVHASMADLSTEQLAYRPSAEMNSIAWLVWHIGRGIDAQVSDLAGTEQVWRGGWSEKFDSPFDESATGYGQSSSDVAAVKASSELLLGYFDDVYEQAITYVKTIDDESLNEVIDTNWDPPVTRGARLVSILGDAWQHVGQAAYLRGMILTK